MLVTNSQYDDPMVIKIEVANFVVTKTLVKQGSLVDILYLEKFNQLILSKSFIYSYDDQTC